MPIRNKRNAINTYFDFSKKYEILNFSKKWEMLLNTT